MDLPLGGSLLWGLVTASSLLLGALVAFRVPMSTRTVGLVLGFGSGVLISAVAFDLVQEAHEISNATGGVPLGLFLGCGAFFAGDVLLGRAQLTADHQDATGNPLAIVLGAVLDGIPEAMVVGLTLALSGEVGTSYVIAVFLSNLPEGIGASQDLVHDGWPKVRIVRLWALVVGVEAAASVLGYLLLQDASPSVIAFVLAFAGGAILTMLGSEMVPEAHDKGGRLVGVVTTLGFGVAYLIHVLA